MKQAWFWQLGLTFMFIPGLINLMVLMYRYCRGRLKNGWRMLAVECAVITPLYPLCVIMYSIDLAVFSLREKVSKSYMENTKELKLVEIIGE